MRTRGLPWIRLTGGCLGLQGVALTDRGRSLSRDCLKAFPAIVNRLQSIIRYKFSQIEPFLAQCIRRLWDRLGWLPMDAYSGANAIERIRVLFVEDEFFIREW